MAIAIAAAFTLAQLYWGVLLIILIAGGFGYPLWRPYRVISVIGWIILVIIGLAVFGMPFATTR